ncbi:hypothetical protein B0H63DRAFT_285562 [Podospora didyma]|uniref:Uncharacterized protein n=1 Tax=Podospora didyma TaxID=330526 RepID=A0AAE0K8D0_9PEZI|nr:hypothetical protein B0H63DRAFT_285562 [Podospora didyma]
MSGCYCANYYDKINCTNTVSKFGERCKLCMTLKHGASLSDGMLSEDHLWMTPPSNHGGGHMHQKHSSMSNDPHSTGRTTRGMTFLKK